MDLVTQPDGLLVLRRGPMVVDLHIQPATSSYQTSKGTATRATPAHRAVLVRIWLPWVGDVHHARLSDVVEWLSALGADTQPLLDAATAAGWPDEN